MKPIPKPIHTGHVDLSRSQLQSPFALVQFLESGFGGIPSMMDLVGMSPTTSYQSSALSSSTSSRRRRTDSGKATYHHQHIQSLSPVIGSPIELTQLKRVPEQETHVPASLDTIVLCESEYKKSSMNISKDGTSSSSPSSQAFTAPPLKRQDSSSLGKRPSQSQALVSIFWSHLPALIIVSAFIFDMPMSPGLTLVSEFRQMSGGSSIMLSLTLCGMLLFWLAGCAMLVLIGLVIYEVVCAVNAESPSNSSRPWEWIVPI